jgi:alginate O-acetyltransferase complex protein AlgJ
MQAVAEALALEIGGTHSVASVADPAATTERGPPFSVTTTNITQLGDIGKMLELPAGQTLIRPETVTIERVTLPAPTAADVLLLGDSFANIYSLAGMGWGDQAGLAEQLSRALGRPVDRIIRNDAGSHATRELLRNEPGRLAGKRMVVWQFAERELAFGDWKRIELPAPIAPPAGPTDDVLARLGRLGVEALARDQMAVVGKDEWLFLSAELRHLGAGPFWGESAAKASQASRDPDPLPAIVDLHRQLSAMGIKLLLVPVPPRAVIYPDKLLDDVPAGAARIDRHHQKFYELLRQQGVTVVDVTDDFRAARATDKTHGPVCCEQDTHWSPRGIEIAVERIAEALDEWPAEPKVVTYRLAPRSVEITGDLVRHVEGFLSARTRPITLAPVSAAPDQFVRVEPDEDSPIILLTDSHGLVFHEGGDMHTEGAGVADLLAARLGVRLDLMARRGSGSEIRIELARRFLGDPTLATRKRVVIYLFAARFFTESETWRPVPLRRANP